jgi:hypothetical protein
MVFHDPPLPTFLKVCSSPIVLVLLHYTVTEFLQVLESVASTCDSLVHVSRIIKWSYPKGLVYDTEQGWRHYTEVRLGWLIFKCGSAPHTQSASKTANFKGM